MADTNYSEKTWNELQEINNENQTGEANFDIPEIQLSNQPQQQLPPDYGYGPVGNAILDQRGQLPSAPMVRSYAQEEIDAGWGKSRFDTRNAFRPYMDLEDVRAREQSGFGKITNGLAKGGVTAAATAVNTTVGTVWGLGSSLFELATNNSKERTFGDIVDAGTNNWLSEQMIKLQNKSEEWFPNYRTEEERTDEYQREWHKHILTPNFIGDSLLKNFGFTAGAMLGGAMWTKAIGAIMRTGMANNLMKGVAAAAEGDGVANAELLQVINKFKAGSATAADIKQLESNFTNAARQINSMKAQLALYGSLLGAMGEGTTEGLMAKNEFLEEFKANADQRFADTYNTIQEDVLGENTEGLVTSVLEIDEDGRTRPVSVLTEDGYKEVDRRRQEAYEKYNKLMEEADAEGERLASTTYLLNLPILTASNVIQFGRLFSGGFKTAKKVQGLKGGIKVEPRMSTTGEYAAPKLVGNYGVKRLVDSPVLRTLQNSAKVASSEAFEEMSQGYVSSGAKNVADVHLAKYINDGYDPDQTDTFREWFSEMHAGGKEYLSDWKNWQEGFLGALTGLFGIPGRVWKGEWYGGLVGSAMDAKQERKEAQAAADELNKLVNSQKFQNDWHGYIRHMKYDAEMNDALAKDDAYAWHTADKEQLVNDIMVFAKNGRLNDLESLVKAYSNLSPEDLDRKGIRDVLVTDHKIDRDTPDDVIIQRVNDKANEMLTAIKQYRDLYDSLVTLMPAGTEENLMDEIMFTGMEMKSFEERFLQKYGEVMQQVDPIIAQLPKFKEEAMGKTKEELQSNLHQAQSMYHEIFSTLAPIEVDLYVQKTVQDALNDLKGVVRNNKQLVKDINDLQKMSEARRNLFRKFQFLQNPAAKKAFDNAAITVDKVITEASKQADRQETEGLTDIGSIHNRFAEVQDKGAFVEALRTRANDGEKPAQDFVKLYDTYNNFRKHLIDTYPTLVVDKETESFNYITEGILNNAFESAANEDEYIDNLTTAPINRNEVYNEIMARIQAKEIPEEYGEPMFFDAIFGGAATAISKGAEEFKKAWVSTKGKENIVNEVKPSDTPESTQKGPDAPAPMSASSGPEVKPETEKAEAKEEKTEPEAPVAEPEQVEEPVEPLPSNIGEAETLSTFKDNTLTEDESYVPDTKGAPRVGYYQQSFPEIVLFDEKDKNTNIFIKLKAWIRDLINPAGNSEEERARSIARTRERIASSIQNFDVAHPSFAPTYQWLSENGAFDYIATKLNKNDKVVFCYMEGCPQYEGSNQIVVSVVKSRNDAGEITAVQPLTTLHQPNALASSDRAKYANLDVLYDAIHKDYDSSEPDGSFYVFGGKKSPITSNVFAIRPGIMSLGGEVKDVKNIDGYSEDAPIMIIGQNNEPVLLRGDIDTSKILMPSTANNENRYGRLYYLVRSGDDNYTPVLLTPEDITEDAFANAQEGTLVDKIGKKLDDIDNLVQQVNGANAKELNARLSPILKELNRYYALNNIFFEFQDLQLGNGTMVSGLHITWGKKDGQQAFIEPGGQETVRSVVAKNIRRPIRISPLSERHSDAVQNLNDSIAEGLITSDAKILRQKGVNFLFDPWNPLTGKFEHLLSGEKAEVVKYDADLGESNPEERRSVQIEKDKINYKSAPVFNSSELPSANNTGTSEYIGKVYNDLTDEQKKYLTDMKQISSDVWDRLNPRQRKKLIDC